MFNIGEILKIDIAMVVITHTIKKGDQILSCVELALELVWNLYFRSVSLLNISILLRNITTVLYNLCAISGVI